MSDLQTVSRLRVWLVHEDVHLAEKVYLALRTEFDFGLFVSTTDAIRAMNQNAFDAIVTDHRTSPSGCFDLLRRSRAACPHATRILIAQHHIPDLRMHLASRLIDAFLLESFAPHELRTRIVALQARPHRVRKPTR